MSGESAFPRGGSLRLYNHIRGSKKNETEHQSENLFKIVQSDNNNKKKRKQTSQQSKKGELTGLDHVINSIKKKQKLKEKHEQKFQDEELFPRRAHRLSKKVLQQGGVKALGIVTKVQKVSAMVSLPNKLYGVIRLEDLSDQHEKGESGVAGAVDAYLKVGELVPCAILPVDDANSSKSGVRVSMAASRINSSSLIRAAKRGSVLFGSVQSVEDHGYQISFGHDSLATGFLSFKNGGGNFDAPAYKIGQGINVLIDSSSNIGGKRVLRLKKYVVPEEEEEKEKDDGEENGATEKKVSKLDGIVPGMFVKGTILQYLQDGMVVSFGGSFIGTVDLFHMESWDIDPAMKGKFPSDEEKNMVGRVLFINDKKIGLTCAKHLMNRTTELERQDARLSTIILGQVFDHCLVKRIDKGRGILLEIDNNDEEGKHFAWGYASRKRIEQDAVDDQRDQVVELDKKYKVGEETRCKVLGYSPIDGVLAVSLSESVIEATVLSYEELEAGMDVKAKVFHVGDRGVRVMLSDHVFGFIPLNHLSDVTISDPSKRFQPGQTLNCKVLSTSLEDVSKPKVLLTNKKTLIKSPLTLIKSHDQLFPGVVAHGVVSAVKKELGIFVTFFNDIYGLVSLNELAALGVEDPEKAFPVGKVVKVKVLSTAGRNRVNLTFRVATDEHEEDGKKEKDVIKSGTLVSGKISKKSKHEFIVLVESPKKYNGRSVILPKTHLTDHPEHSDKLFKKCYKVGTRIENGLVLFSKDGNAFLTIKPALLQAHANHHLPRSIADIMENSTTVGYVKSVTKLGIFVAFLDDLTGFVPRGNIADAFIKDATEHATLGQTLITKIVEVNQEGKRFTLSLKSSVLDVDDGSITACIETYFQEQRMIYASKLVGFTHKVGDIVDGVVGATKEHGMEIHLGKMFQAFCPNDQMEKKQKKAHLQEGDKVSCRIIDIDLGTENMVTVSLHPSLLSHPRSTQQLSKEQDHTAIVLMEKPMYTVVSVDNGRVIALAPTTSFNGRIRGVPSRFENGFRGQVKVLPCHDEKSLILVKWNVPEQTSSSKKRVRSIGALLSTMDESGPTVHAKTGMTVTGKVLDIARSNVLVGLPRRIVFDEYAGYKTHGLIHLSDFVSDDELEDYIDKNEPLLQGYEVGDDIQVKIVGVDTSQDRKGNSILNVHLVPENNSNDDGDDGEKRKKKKKKTRKSHIQEKENASSTKVEPKPETYEDVDKDAVYAAFVERIGDDEIFVSLSRGVRGIIYCTQVSKDIALLSKIFNDKDQDTIKAATVIRVKVLQLDPVGHRLQLTML